MRKLDPRPERDKPAASIPNTSPVSLTILTNVTFANDGSSRDPAEATRAIYHGTYNSQAAIIRCYWSGSVNGITPVVNGEQFTQLPSDLPGHLSGLGTMPFENSWKSGREE